jgi:tubulin-specific chaperone A
MPAPTPLDVATQSVKRLVKEEGYYHKELDNQKDRIAKLEKEIAAGSDDQNAEYILRQEVRFICLVPSCSS